MCLAFCVGPCIPLLLPQTHTITLCGIDGDQDERCQKEECERCHQVFLGSPQLTIVLEYIFSPSKGTFKISIIVNYTFIVNWFLHWTCFCWLRNSPRKQKLKGIKKKKRKKQIMNNLLSVGKSFGILRTWNDLGPNKRIHSVLCPSILSDM